MVAALLLSLDNVSRETMKKNTFQHIEISLEQRKLLDQHLRLVVEINKTLNLTRITSWDKGQILHIEDSLLGLEALNKAPEGIYVDIGTGGGFPGIPLAITSGRKTVLVDSVGKKIQALDSIIKEIDLENQIQTFNGRVEELAYKKPNSFAVITARALSSLPSLLELSSPLLCDKGQLICYKAQPGEKEINQAVVLENKLGMKLIQVYEGYLSDKESYRALYIFEKIHDPEVSLPRRSGMAQRRPYTS